MAAAPPRLAGRLTVDLILSAPQGFNAVKDYSIDLRGTHACGSADGAWILAGALWAHARASWRTTRLTCCLVPRLAAACVQCVRPASRRLHWTCQP